MVRTTTATDLTRIVSDFACPECGSESVYSPTYRARKCTACGHRGDAVDFATAPTCECPDCGDENVRSHVDDVGNDVFTCKACITRYTN